MAPTILAVIAVCALPFYAGYRLYSGDAMQGRRGIMSMVSDGMNALAQALGTEMAGLAVMAGSVGLAAVLITILWRNI